MHRSVTFWSGLFLLVCLVWGWWDSGRYCTHAGYSQPAATLSIYSYDATLRGTLNTAPGAFIRSGFNYGHTDYGGYGRTRTLKMKHSAFYFDFGGPYREFRIAAWIVIVIFIDVWILALLWSHRRRRKREEALLAPEVEKEGPFPFPLYRVHVAPPPASSHADKTPE